MAKQLVAILAPHKPLFIEEPLLPGHVPEIARLAQQTAIPIALGERLFTRQDFRPYLEQGAVDLVQPDVSHAGGLSETRRIASLAETYDVGLLVIFRKRRVISDLAICAVRHIVLMVPSRWQHLWQ